MANRLKQALQSLRDSLGYREIRTMDVVGANIKLNDQADNSKHLINLSGNDYLGLAGDIELQQSFFKLHAKDTKQNWMASSSARPLTGSNSAHTELEETLANSYSKDSALLFNSGYHTNTGILPAITSNKDLIIADKLVHASIIDGLKLASCDYKRFAHNSMSHLRALLEKNRDKYEKVWVVTESVFSMDGDVAPIAELVELKKLFDLNLYIDEAHGVGCFGETGLGLCEELDLLPEIDLLIGTFGKALAGYGGFVVCDELYKQALVNFSRSWLFSTSLPPINIEWNLHAWKHQMQRNDLRQVLANTANELRDKLTEQGLTSCGSSHIVPAIYSSNEEAVNGSLALQEAGILALPIRSPTVRAGTERIRFSLTANLPDCIPTIINTLSEYEAQLAKSK